MLRTALIGLGKMGISHLAMFRAHPEVEVVAICDPSKIVASSVAQLTGLKAYGDYRDLFNREKLDAIVVATPSRLHFDIVRQALELGIHVFCEKPFCLDPEQGQVLAEMAQAKGLVGQVGYHFRFVGSFQEMKRLIGAGAIGEITNIRAEAYGPVVLRPKGSTWRSSKTEGGGCLYDYASHALDLMNYMVGPPSDVKGTVINQIFSRDVDDEVYSTLVYDSGMCGQLLANWSDESFRKMSMKINVWGKAGRIQADRQEIQIFTRDRDLATANGLQLGWNVKYTTELTQPVWYYLRGEEYSAQVDAFVMAAKGDASRNISSFSDAVKTDRTIVHLLQDNNQEKAVRKDTSGLLRKIFRGDR